MNDGAYITEMDFDINFVSGCQGRIVLRRLKGKEIAIETSISTDTLKKLADMYNSRSVTPFIEIIELISA